MALTGIELSSGIVVGSVDPLDKKYGPFDTLTTAKSEIGETFRYQGLTVGITGSGELIEYWWQDGTTDSDLVLKSNPGASFPFTGSAQITGSLGVTGSISVTGSDIFINDITIGLGNGQLDSNIVFGSGAFASNTTGTASVAIGSNALASNVDTDGNLAIGQEALFNTVNNFNTGIGYRTLYSNISGSRNTAIGRQALEDNTTGDRNTGIGQRAAEGNSTGNDNTAIGDRALVHNRSGSFNIAIGTDAARGLDQNTDFSSVTAIGAFTLRSLASGSANTAIGVSSSFSLHSGSNNISIGNLSANAFESGSNNVFIGGYDGSNHTTSNNNILFSDGEGNIRLFVTGSNGSVGIGTVLPSEKLTVEGNISASGEIIGSSFNITNITGSNISASGNIIGDILTVNGITFPQDTNIIVQTPDEVSFGDGGNITIESGDGAGPVGNGGDLIFNSGRLSGGGTAGNIIINTRGQVAAGAATSGSFIVNSENFYIDSNGNITSSANISASGDITGDKLIVVNGGNPENVSIYKSGDVTTGLYFPGPSAVAITAAGGDVEFQVSEGLINTEGSLSHTGNITSSANISASGYVSASEGSFGSGATTINTSINTTGNITSSANISASGDITGDTGNFNTVSVTGEYTLPSTDGSANQIIKTNGAGVLSFTTPTPVPTIYTPDVYEINSVTGISSTNTLLTFRGSGDPTIIDGTTGTTRTDSVDNSITFNSEGIFEISYSVQMQQGASTGGTRMNPQVYAKFGTNGSTSVAAGSSNITYIRLIGSNQAPNGACTCTFYVNVTGAEDILELLVTFTQPATNIDLDIVQFESVPNTLSIRKIT